MSPCGLGVVFQHPARGGATLSGHDYTATAGFNPPGGGLDFNFEDEWLSSLSLWGPIQPRTSNQLGETIHNFGNPSDCVNFTGLGCVAFARTVPEPASIWLLLGLLGVIGLLRVGKRRKLLRL